jgi:hypothetical protein
MGSAQKSDLRAVLSSPGLNRHMRAKKGSPFRNTHSQSFGRFVI